MQDWYQMPALVLTALLLPAFGYLYRRNRDIRNLLWFLAFVLVVFRAVLVYSNASWDFGGSERPWNAAGGQAAGLLAAGLFLASLSPRSFRIGKIRILYAIAFTAPLMLYAALMHEEFHASMSPALMYWVFPALGVLSVAAGLPWAMTKGRLPAWIAISICLLFGVTAIAVYFQDGLNWPLVLAESGAHFMMAMLVLFVYRRASPGVIISVLGFLVWSAPPLLLLPTFRAPEIYLLLVRSVLMSKVAAALGLIVLTLENELERNMRAGIRERRVRQELESYTRLVLSRRSVDEFDLQANDICRTIVQNSRFSQAALILQHQTGAFRVAGTAGLDGALVQALDSVVDRIPAEEFLGSGSGRAVTPDSQVTELDFRPWLVPGDDLEQLRFTSALAIPLMGRGTVEGALLVAAWEPDERLRSDDLIPLEVLASRLQANRSQTRMLEKLIDAEKFSGIGQLAGNVSQQLNNPLTVILGYAALLQEPARSNALFARAVEAILASARSMRTTIESLQRVASSPARQLSEYSVAELLGDMERLHRSEFLQRSIQFKVSIAPELPHVRCEAQQLRQAVLHCLQFAMQAVERQDRNSERTVQLEAKLDGHQVQIVIAHSGQSFQAPERAFDPFATAQAGEQEPARLGLSLCATILRENNGKVSAMNLEPRGAAIVLNLQAA